MNFAAFGLACLGLASLPQRPAQPSPANSSEFHAQSVTQTAIIRLSSTVDDVFPLFTPEDEKRWAPDWDPQYLYPADGSIREGMVFETGQSRETIWLVSHYDVQKHEITYANLTPGKIARLIKIGCRPEGGETVASVAYTLTSLSPEANTEIEEYTAEHHAYRLRQWEIAINHFLRTGHTIGHAE